MKKVLFSLAAVLMTTFVIYSCQKDSAEQVVPVTNTGDPNLAVTSRDYADCDACYEDCYDCCLKFERISGSLAFAFIDPATGNVVTRKFTSVTPQEVYVCAAGGYFAILAAGGSGKVTVCSTGQNITRTGVNVQGSLNVLNCFISVP